MLHFKKEDGFTVSFSFLVNQFYKRSSQLLRAQNIDIIHKMNYHLKIQFKSSESMHHLGASVSALLHMREGIFYIKEVIKNIVCLHFYFMIGYVVLLSDISVYTGLNALF